MHEAQPNATSSSSSSVTGEYVTCTKPEQPELNFGCKHYRRNCQVLANCCQTYFTCRFCHDETFADSATPHQMDRHAVERIKCLCCDTEQPVADSCVKCFVQFASYFCSICNFYDNTPGKQIYHCDKCGICRVGKGLGIDFFHCDKCQCCLPISIRAKHACVEGTLVGDCPICLDDMFNSRDAAFVARCGHAMHSKCFEQYARTNWRCPLCWQPFAKLSLSDKSSEHESSSAAGSEDEEEQEEMELTMLDDGNSDDQD